MITWSGIEIIRQARFANGSLPEGYVISGNELADDLMALNMLLASWDATLYAHTEETYTLTGGDAEYSWGAGGNINTARPIDLLDMTFIRDTSDYPLTLITEREYKGYIDKSTSDGRPDKIFFDPRMPLAYIYFYPIPDAAYVVHLTSLKGITEITDATATVNVPQEMAAALKWNLALEIAPNYNVPISAVLQSRAMETKRVVMARALSYKMDTAKFDNVTGDYQGTGGSILGWD